MLKKIFLTCALAAVVSAGAAPAARAADDNLLQTIKSRGTMRVCDVDYAPWNVKNPGTNQWEGINVDIADLVAGMLKVKIEHVDATWATVIPSMTTQKCDFSAAGLYISPSASRVDYLHSTICNRRHISLRFCELSGKDDGGPG
jgi:ABC-type amino acid transport substrate-binding protein